jgi:glycosyltransferase-like protein
MSTSIAVTSDRPTARDFATRDPAPVALLSYSTRPRGGVVHTVALAEALYAKGWPVHLYVLGDPAKGLYRPTSAPHTVFPAAPRYPKLEDRVFAAIDAMEAGLADALPEDVRVLHAQDCIAGRAAVRVRERRPDTTVVRTVHHVDDFTTPALIECQLASIHEPDHLLVVSRYWQEILRSEHGVDSTVVTNGVDAERFAVPAAVDPLGLRERVGTDGRLLFLTVGGLEPRKGGYELVEAFAAVRDQVSPTPKLVVVGGQSFQDHEAYRRRCLDRAEELGLGDDLILAGTVSEEELPAWYQAADVFVLPSVNEGWGLVVLEAMASSLPVIVTDLPVFGEYLTAQDAEMVPPHDAPALASAMVALANDAKSRRSRGQAGPAIARRFSWGATAEQHIAAYGALESNSHDARRSS